MTWLYKLLVCLLLLGVVFLIYKNVTLNKENTRLSEVAVKKELEDIKNRNKLIDSIQTSKILITKELLSNDINIKKLKKELSKTNSDSITIKEALEILNIK